MLEMEFKDLPFEVVHRAAFAMDEDQRRYEIWQDEFEKQYNVKFGKLNAKVGLYSMAFPTDRDYMMFMLKWS